jgi:hypothetical protein
MQSDRKRERERKNVYNTFRDKLNSIAVTRAQMHKSLRYDRMHRVAQFAVYVCVYMYCSWAREISSQTTNVTVKTQTNVEEQKQNLPIKHHGLHWHP